MTTIVQKRTVDTAFVTRLVDDMVTRNEADKSISPLPHNFLAALHCHCDFNAVYSYDLTDDEHGIAEQLMRVLALFLRDPDAIDDSDIARVLHGILAHERWLHPVRDHDAAFNITSAIVHLAENVIAATPEINNVFQAIAGALAHSEWPFLCHGGLAAVDLRAGQIPTLQVLCDGAFGPVWWQLVDPEANEISVSAAILSMRPPLLHFARLVGYIALPDLGTPGAA